jgi:hypothetical protein
MLCVEFKFKLGVAIYFIIMPYRIETFCIASQMSHVLQIGVTPTEIWLAGE